MACTGVLILIGVVARAIVGGLAFSTIVTLVMLPTIYVLLDDVRNWSLRMVRMSAR